MVSSKPVPRSLVVVSVGLAGAAVVLTEVGLVRELLHDRDLVAVFVPASALVAVVAAAAGRELLMRLRRQGDGDSGLPPGRTRPVLAPTMTVSWAAAGFAAYDPWVDWLMTAAFGALLFLVLAPALWAWLRQ